MKIPFKSLRAFGALGAAAVLFACGDNPDSVTQPFAGGPSFHVVPVANPEVELLAVCKVGPAGTYTFQATATQPILFNTVSGTWDLSSASYSVTVGAGSTIDVGGTTVGGACFSFSTATGTHNHIARASGTSIVDVTLVESGIPAGQEFVKVDKYQKTGGQSGAVVLTSSNANTVTAQVGGTNGGPTSLVGANVVFYNQTTPLPSLSITKTADAASVTAGSQIGFTITVTSNGPATATSVTLSDPLPTGTGIVWTDDSADCSIAANVLTCSFGDLAAGASRSVHVTSPTTAAVCASYPNTASASATNHATVTASATTATVNCEQWGDETAVGAGIRWPGTSNWFMYTPYTTNKVDLIAGQHYDAGDIFMSKSGGMTHITINLTSSSWRWAARSGNLKIIPMVNAPTTYVSPGKYPYHFNVSGSSVTVSVPGTNWNYIGIHGDVQRLLP